jgi:hypothetical protein
VFVAEVRADPVAVWMRHRCLFAPGARTKYHLLRSDFRDWVRPILGEVPHRMPLTRTAAALGHKIAFDVPADGVAEFQDIALLSGSAIALEASVSGAAIAPTLPAAPHALHPPDAPAAGPAPVEPAQRPSTSGNEEA